MTYTGNLEVTILRQGRLALTLAPLFTLTQQELTLPMLTAAKIMLASPNSVEEIPAIWPDKGPHVR